MRNPKSSKNFACCTAFSNNRKQQHSSAHVFVTQLARFFLSKHYRVIGSFSKIVKHTRLLFFFL